MFIIAAGRQIAKNERKNIVSFGEYYINALRVLLYNELK